MASPVTYRVHENAVLSYRGEVSDLVWDVLRDTREIAQNVTAPRRSGRLANNIRAARPKPSGIYQFSGTCSSSVGYSLYVHDGVKGRIYPRGKYLTVPHVEGPLSGAALKASGGSGRAKLYFLAKSVRGQRPQPFMAEALTIAIGKSDLLSTRVS